jgi:acetoin utilization deacetylase AcuC-like enzyme
MIPIGKRYVMEGNVTASRTGLVLDDVFLSHETGLGHQDSPHRYEVLSKRLHVEGIVDACVRLPPVLADEAVITLCHDRLYLETVKEDIAAGRGQLSTGSTAICARSLECALYAAGGAMVAVDAVMSGRLCNAFCAVRPGGHHATRVRGMGFCIFNTEAIAARYAQRAHGVDKVLIVDWDVHHGNGTQDIFYEDGSVFYFSTHQSHWYPHTGKAAEIGRGFGKGTTLNCPFLAGAGRSKILGAIRDKLVPAAERFKPELVIIAAGFDSRVDDPLGRFLLEDDDFADLTRIVMDIADSTAGGRIISILAGGYNPEGLASAASSHLRVLTGMNSPVRTPTV